MVRIKHRYLLVQILYPNSPATLQGDSRGQNIMLESIATENDASRSTAAMTLKSPSNGTRKPLKPLTPILNLHAPTSDAVTIPLLLKQFRTELSSLFGDYGSAIAGSGLSIKYWSNATSTLILRCERAAFRLVWAACTTLRSLRLPRDFGQSVSKNTTRAARDLRLGMHNDQEVSCVMKVLKVSGTVRKCEEEAIRRATVLCGRIKGASVALDGNLNVGDRVGLEAVDSDSGGSDTHTDREET